MCRVWTLAAAVMAVTSAAARAETLLRNGGFETARAVKGAPAPDGGFGLWTLGEGSLAPTGWTLNPAYPGECSVLAEGAHGGKRFLRLRGTAANRSTHIYQPCGGIKAGAWYRVSAWVRGGRASLYFYEYYENGPIRAPMIATLAGPQKTWRQVTGYYLPAGPGFKAASLAVTVAKGESADVDDVSVELVPATAAPPGLKPIVVENSLIRLQISPAARVGQLACKATSVDYATAACPIPLCTAWRAGCQIPARLVRRRGEAIEVEFVDPDVRATLRVEARKRYVTVEVTDVQPADVERLDIEFPMKRLATLGPAFAANYDETFAACCFALNLSARSWVHGRGEGAAGIGASCQGPRGPRGAKIALVASPRDQFQAVIQEVERDNGLPCPVLDGKWARESEPVRRSYLFAIGMHEDDTDTLIRAARLGHFQTILILKNAWLTTHGHYEINRKSFPRGLESLKAVVAKIHAAGLKAGVHLFGPSVSPNDPYVTPVPDERLLTVPCPPLAEDVDAKATTLTLTAQPDLPPKRSRSKAFPGYHLRVGDEIVRYRDVEAGPPFRFTGCQRGACGTRPAPHGAGARVRGLLSQWGFFLIDPDTPILDEVTTRFARIVNECGIDMVYFDASDGSRDDYFDVRYYLDKCHWAFYRKLDHGVLYQTSTGTGRNLMWHIVPRSASADGHGDIKGYLDQRLPTILGMRNNLTFADIGWYGLDLGSRTDRLEYVVGKCLGTDGSISVQANRRILESHPHAREILEMVGRYERCRLANVPSPSVKARLREKRSEFKLFDDGKGGWRLFHAAYEAERVITRLDGKQNTWTVQNDLAHPCRLAVELTRNVPDAPGLKRMPELTGLALTVNGTRIALPGKVGRRESLTTDGLGSCTVWPGGMAPGRTVAAPPTAVRLKPGRNDVAFACDVAPGCRPDVNLRLIRLWPLEE